jgi:hypothetical protein
VVLLIRRAQTMIAMSAFNASSFYKAQFLQDAAEEAKKK